MLQQVFIELTSKYNNNNTLINELWQEIEKNYSNKKRHYHNLSHLENLFIELEVVKQEIKNWDGILFTLFYHDVVYNVLKQNNEEKSAALAQKRMQELGMDIGMIESCTQQILATKSHTLSNDTDCNYFTDADLSVFGKDWETYKTYFNNIRKEYSIYPDFIYNSGRKKVLQHFLSMKKIYKTNHFFSKYEETARENLRREMEEY